MWIGEEDIYLPRIKGTKKRMADSVKQKDWSESSFSFGNRYNFILCCQQRGIRWSAVGDSLAEVGLCPLVEAGSSSF